MQAVQGEKQEELPGHKYLPFPWEGSGAGVASLFQWYVTFAGECFCAFGAIWPEKKSQGWGGFDFH